MMMLKMINPMSSMPVSSHKIMFLLLLMLVSLLQAVPGAGEGKEEPGLTREELQVTYDTLR